MEQPIFQKIEDSNKPDFGDILSKSFELFKKVWEQALYHVLVTMVVVVPMIVLIYVPYIVFAIYMAEYDGYGNYQSDIASFAPLLILYGIVVFIVIFISQAIVYGITAHFLRVLQKEDTGTPKNVGGYFDLITGNFKKLFLLALASFVIALLAILLCYLPIFYVMVPLQLLVLFFAFNPELSVSDIVKASFKLGNKYWLIIFGLTFISSLIAQVGILLCIVGVFFTAYFVHVPMYFLYKDTIGFDSDSDEDSFLISS